MRFVVVVAVGWQWWCIHVYTGQRKPWLSFLRHNPYYIAFEKSLSTGLELLSLQEMPRDFRSPPPSH